MEVGPLSVGSGLFERAKSFGGDVLTTTDVAMVAGVADLLPLATPPELSPSLVYRVMQEIHKKLETVIDKVKVGGLDMFNSKCLIESCFFADRTRGCPCNSCRGWKHANRQFSSA